ncbi:MAG: hypothetical protein ACE5H4_13380 [Candidatus Thorarchaeota archaeon]
MLIARIAFSSWDSWHSLEIRFGLVVDALLTRVGMFELLGVIVFIGTISVALPTIFPSLLSGCATLLVAFKPEDHDGWLFYGELLIKQNQHLEAVDACKTAAKLRPDISEIWMKLGNLLAELGKFDKADKAFRVGVDSDIL